MVVSSPCGAHGVLLAHHRRGRLERDAEVHRLAVGDAALHAAAAIGARPHAIALHVEGVVVLEPGEIGAGEAGADLEALARRQAQHRAGEVGLEAVEDRLAPARRTAARHARHDAAQRVAVLARRLDGGDHLRGERRRRDSGSACASTSARVTRSRSAVATSRPTLETNATISTPQRDGEQLARDRARRHARRGLARAGAPAAAPVADAVLRLRRCSRRGSDETSSITSA